LKAESLEKITYPTGGQAIFEYEPHEYSSYVNRKDVSQLVDTVNTLTGGLRIRKIKLLDHKQHIIKETDYIYKKDYNSDSDLSSGILAGIPEYRDKFEFTIGEGLGEYVVVVYNDYIPGPLSLTNGNHITYSEVVEKVKGNGFTVHTFTNFDSSGMYSDENALKRWASLTEKDTPISSLAYIRGKPLTQSIYSENKKLLKQVVNKYSTFSINLIDNNYVRSVYTIPFYYNSGGLMAALDFPYKIYTGKHNLTSQTVTIYDAAQSEHVSTTKTYSYNSDNFLQSDTTVASDGSRLITKYNYTKDILGRGGIEKSAYQWLVDNHILRTPIEQLTYKNNQLINASFVNYKTFPDIPAARKVYPSEILQLETEKPLVDYNTTGIDTRLKPQLYYDRYDENGNVLQVHKVDGFTVSYLWGYDKLYPIAEIVGVTYDETVSALGENDLQILSGNAVSDEELRTKMQLLRNNLPKAMVTSYTHRPLVGMTSQTDPNGITTYYEYDEFNRLKIERDHEGNVLKQYEYHYYQNE
jgi:YD repeat-containing protein